MTSAVVRGSARRTVAPDRATLSLAVSLRAADAAAALDQVAASTTALSEVLDDLGIGPTDRSTGAVEVTEEWEWRDNSNVRVGFRATASVAVELRDTARVGVVLRDAIAVEGAQVRGLTWTVDDEHPARIELLAAAARDARLRATTYAAALGLELGAVELVSEDPIPPEPRPFAPAADAAAFAMSKRESAPEMAVDAGRVELRASVNVRFALLPQRGGAGGASGGSPASGSPG